MALLYWGSCLIKAVAKPAVYELDNTALTAYQSLTFQPRTPRKMSAWTDDAAFEFQHYTRGLSSLHHGFQPLLV